MLAAALVLTGYWAAPAWAAETVSGAPVAEPQPLFFGTQQRKTNTFAMIGALREKARNQGVVRVIAGLRMAVRPDRLTPIGRRCRRGNC
jgi:hypothetical protein